MYGPKLPKLRGKRHPETEDEVAEVGGEVVAIGNTAAGGAVVPTAAATHAVGARCRSLWIGLAATAVIAFPVATPLPHIPAHIEQTQPIRTFGPYRVSLAVGITAIPGIAPQAAFAVGASPFGTTGGSTTCRILPFGLGGQSVVLSRGSAHPFTIGYGIVPAYMKHRMVMLRLGSFVS